MLGIAGHGFQWLHIPLLMSWLMLYVASYPLMMIFRSYRHIQEYKKWLVLYGLIAVAFLIFPIIRYPALLWLGGGLFITLLVNFYYVRIRQERAMLNNFSAVAGMSLGGVASGYVGAGDWSFDLFLIWLICVAFFMGSVFFVKSMIRERGNLCFRALSWFYHGAVVLIVFVCSGSWLLTAAFLASLIRAIFTGGRTLSAWQIGILELVNSMLFLILAAVYF
ncbi:YwiC-like family protein [Desulfotomaculum varum]